MGRSMEFTGALALTRHVLQNPLGFEWSIRGSGRTMRLDMGDGCCLHVWRPSLATAGVSVIHDHPWNLTSLVVIGRLVNRTYKLLHGGRPTHMQQLIECGYEGELIGSPSPCVLTPSGNELVCAGSHYSEDHSVIHESDPVEGTVTIVKRVFVEGHVPSVFWRYGEERRHVQPRPARQDEVLAFCAAALAAQREAQP